MASKRKALCVDQKVALIRAIEKGEKKSDVGKRFGFSPSTVATIWKNKDKILHAETEGSSCKKIRKPKFEDLDQAMLTWFHKQRCNNVPIISGPVLKTKAEHFAQQLGIIDFKASEGWLGKFKQRHNITYGKISGEALVNKFMKSEYQSEYTQLSNEYEEVNPAHEPKTILLIPSDVTALADGFMPSSSDDENNEKSKSKRGRPAFKRSCSDRLAVRECNRERTELIHQALATLIATNGLPVSFCSSPGFGQFMAVAEPNYKLCRVEAMRTRLNSLKSTVEDKIRIELKNADAVVCGLHSYRPSSAENIFVSLTAHVIDDRWSPKSFTLAALEMPEHRPAEYLADKITGLWDDWEINGKVTTVIADDEENLAETVGRLPVAAVVRCNETEVACAARGLQLAVDAALREEPFAELIKRCGVLVEHFEHSDALKKSLSGQREEEQQQQQPGTGGHRRPPPLVQHCKTRWTTIHSMLDSVLKNRLSISNVLADRTVTPPGVARQLEFTEAQWSIVECLVGLLTPLNVVTNVFRRENDSPVSMVRPLLAQLLDKHLKPLGTDDKTVECFKRTVIAEIKELFKLDSDETGPVSVKQIASFLDPRYKDLTFESVPAVQVIRSVVKDLMDLMPPQGRGEPLKSAETSDLEFLYGNPVTDVNDTAEQFRTYVAEPPLRYDLNPYEWWKSREHQYPTLAALAKKFFAIPASSVSHDRCFPAAGNTVSSTNNDVDTLIFLYQNRKLLPE